VAHRKIERASIVIRWKAESTVSGIYSEWHIEKLDGRLSLSDRKHGFWNIVSGTVFTILFKVH
jgi:hypothetical protein